MPLLRHSLYSQNVNLYLAPTADGRDTWVPLMRTIACEGRCVVLSSNQCIREGNLPEWITGSKNDGTNGVNGHGPGKGLEQPRLRRKSTVTEDGHEIALPDTTPTSSSPSRLRRQSMVTEDGHEIILPDLKSTSASPPRLRRKSTVTEDGHSIALPDVKHEAIIDETSETTSHEQPDAGEFVSHGGSCIISPLGEVLAGPLWDDENGLLVVDVDFEDCLRGRLDLDVGGSYSRNDAFKLTVEGLDLSPPP